MMKLVGLPLILSVLTNPVLLGKITYKLEGEASMQTKSLTSSGGTGSTVPASGPYRCGSHKQVIVTFVKGTKFATCPAGNHKTTWAVVRESEADASISTK